MENFETNHPGNDNDNQQQPRDALADGRRIYMGNLLYSVTPGDIEQMLQDTGHGQFDKVHISIDPVSGRNPGYCFIEFCAREGADRALAELPGTLLFGRPVKVGPCHPKTQRQSRWPGSRGSNYQPTFQRWGDWRAGDADAVAAKQLQLQREAEASGQSLLQRDDSVEEQGPSGAIRHIDIRNRVGDGTQLYVGGLGKMIDQEHHDIEMRELFAGFDFVIIGKRITAHESTRHLPGNHNYCFVDFRTPEEAARALNTMNGAPLPGGGYLKLSYPRHKVTKHIALPGVQAQRVDRWGQSSLGEASRGSWEPRNDGYREPPRGRSGYPAHRERAQNGLDGDREQRSEKRREQSERQKAIMAAASWRSGAGATA